MQDSRGYQDTWNAFIQDSWRIKPTLTLNAGVAWVVQLPFAPGNSTFSTTDMASFCGPYGQKPDGYCQGLYQVGGDSTVGKQVPEFNELTKGTHGYKVDYKQFSPNIGMAWRPNVEGGILLDASWAIPKQATLRFGFSIGFNQPSVGTGVYGGNPGRSISATRNNNGATYPLVGPGETWPVLFRDPSRLGPPPGIDEISPAYPILAVPGNDLNLYDPALKTPYTRLYSVGLQRAIGKDMAVEVRYVGTQSLRNWSVQNWNDFNIYETGFLDEFKKAQSNLRATVEQGLCAALGDLHVRLPRAQHGNRTAADLPRIPDRVEGHHQSRRVYRDELHEHDVPRPAQHVPAERGTIGAARRSAPRPPVSRTASRPASRRISGG